MAEEGGLRSEIQDAIINEARRVEEDCLYSAKGHFEAGRAWSKAHLWIGLPSAILAAIASASAFQSAEATAGILAAVVVALAALSTFLNPNERAVSHHTAGTRYNAIRNQARIFRTIELPMSTAADGPARLRELAQQRDDLNQASPQIPRWAFARARKAIESGEASYEVDKVV
jgi:hypothetical protein